MTAKQAELPQLKLKEPKMYTAQVYLGSGTPIRENALQTANEEFGSFANVDNLSVVMAMLMLNGKCDWMDLTKLMTKDIGDQLFPIADRNAQEDRIKCGCGKGFKMRLSED